VVSDQIKQVMEIQRDLEALRLRISPEVLRAFKEVALSDRRLAYLTSRPNEVRTYRKMLGIVPVYKRVDTCGAEFESSRHIFTQLTKTEDEAGPTDRRKIMILGSGPNRIDRNRI